MLQYFIFQADQPEGLIGFIKSSICESVSESVSLFISDANLGRDSEQSDTIQAARGKM